MQVHKRSALFSGGTALPASQVDPGAGKRRLAAAVGWERVDMTTQWVQEATGAERGELARGDSNGSECDHPEAHEHDTYAERRHAMVCSTSR
jgi:hypothetical protein